MKKLQRRGKGTEKPRPKKQFPARQTRPPLNPYVVLLIALLLPGMGQVANKEQGRGLLMVFFMVSLGWVTYHLTTPEHSWVGRHAGGVFVYAMSLLDAYKWARVRWEYYFRHGTLPKPR